MSPINSGGGAANLALNAGTAAITVQDVGALAPLGTFAISSGMLMLNGAATASQIAISTGEIVTGPTAALNATLPFTSFTGPAALTLSGPASGGIFGRDGGPSNWLLVTAPGLMVITPNASSALPIVWLRGVAAGKPVYEFWDNAATRPVYWNGPPVRNTLTPELNYDELRRYAEDFTSRSGSDLTAEIDARAAAPDVCAPASAEASAALTCETPAVRQ